MITDKLEWILCESMECKCGGTTGECARCRAFEELQYVKAVLEEISDLGSDDLRDIIMGES